MCNFLKRLKCAIQQRYVFLQAKSLVESSFAFEVKRFYQLLSRYNASVNTDGDKQKMEYTLLRENHIIEKGMSMKSPRKGFGQEKVLSLLHRLEKYYNQYGNSDCEFLRYPLTTIKKYIVYTKNNGVEIGDIENRHRILSKAVRCDFNSDAAGVVLMSRDEIRAAAKGDFKSLVNSRHSIRYFDQTALPSIGQIEAALEIAQRTPSACNRQAWHTHVFRGTKSIELVRWQGGCRGFEDEITSAILVTADLKGFLWHEVYQAYVDGGLYAMNLINAIHSLGMGTIPLSTGFDYKQIQNLSQFDIPENEVPILIIGFGNLMKDFNVAVSTRKPISKTNVFH